MLTLSVTDTLLALVPLIPVLLIYLYWQLKSGELLIASARMVLQLVAIGFVLTFLFERQETWLGILILLFMLCVSSVIVIRPLSQRATGILVQVFISLGISGGLVLIWTLVVVLRLDPWYQPNFVIPIAGMIFANGMNGLSLCAERLEKELQRGTLYKEARSLSFGAAMIPQINAFLAVGLVALPGMMTGQILSGVSPLIAVRYQIMVMAMIMATTCLSVCLYLWLQERAAERKSRVESRV